jgi:hypothetical protein
LRANIFFDTGTKSIPPLQKGWHRKILFRAKKDPLKNPCISIA